MIYSTASIPNGKRVEQTATILSRFETGIPFSLTVSYEALSPSVQEEISIYGSHGSIFSRRFHIKRSINPPLLIEQYGNGESHQISFTESPDPSKPLDDLLNGIRSGNPIVSDGRSTLPTVAFIDAAYRSIREHREIDIVC